MIYWDFHDFISCYLDINIIFHHEYTGYSIILDSTTVIFNSFLVGGWPTHLNKMLISWDDDIPYMMESHKIPWFQTTNQINICVLLMVSKKSWYSSGNGSSIILDSILTTGILEPLVSSFHLRHGMAHLMEPCRDAAAQVMQLVRNDGARKLLGTDIHRGLVDWLVVQYPSWKIWVSQWEGWHPIYYVFFFNVWPTNLLNNAQVKHSYG